MVTEFLALPSPPEGPAEGPGRTLRALPFAIVGAGVLAIFLTFNWHILGRAGEVTVTALAVALVLMWLAAPWPSLPRAAQALLPMTAIMLIVSMQVFALPLDRDVAALMLLPVLWSALYGTAREALAVVALAIAAIAALQAAAMVTAQPVGLTGWTETLAMTGGMLLLTYFTVSARSHARTDPLTRVANRRAWDGMLELEMGRARRVAGPLTIALIDLDHFKRFNDAFGHPEGDRHLAACASAWAACLRQTDAIARIGGEEFAVLLAGSDQGAALDVVRRLAGATPNGQTCSIGLAQWDGAEAASVLMDRADDALYAAKAAGRGRVEVASHPSLNEPGPPVGGPVMPVAVRGA